MNVFNEDDIRVLVIQMTHTHKVQENDALVLIRDDNGNLCCFWVKDALCVIDDDEEEPTGEGTSYNMQQLTLGYDGYATQLVNNLFMRESANWTSPDNLLVLSLERSRDREDVVAYGGLIFKYQARYYKMPEVELTHCSELYRNGVHRLLGGKGKGNG